MKKTRTLEKSQFRKGSINNIFIKRSVSVTVIALKLVITGFSKKKKKHFQAL